MSNRKNIQMKAIIDPNSYCVHNGRVRAVLSDRIMTDVCNKVGADIGHIPKGRLFDLRLLGENGNLVWDEINKSEYTTSIHFEIPEIKYPESCYPPLTPREVSIHVLSRSFLGENADSSTDPVTAIINEKMNYSISVGDHHTRRYMEIVMAVVLAASRQIAHQRKVAEEGIARAEEDLRNEITYYGRRETTLLSNITAKYKELKGSLKKIFAKDPAEWVKTFAPGVTMGAITTAAITYFGTSLVTGALIGMSVGVFLIGASILNKYIEYVGIKKMLASEYKEIKGVLHSIQRSKQKATNRHKEIIREKLSGLEKFIINQRAEAEIRIWNVCADGFFPKYFKNEANAVSVEVSYDSERHRIKEGNGKKKALRELSKEAVEYAEHTDGIRGGLE